MNILSITLALGKAVNELAAVMDKSTDLMNVAIAKIIKHRMNLRRYTYIASFSCLTTVLASKPAYSLTFTIGNNANPIPFPGISYGQSFTPNVGGNAADGNFAIVSSRNPSTVYLNSFTFNHFSYNMLPITLKIYNSSGNLITSSIFKNGMTYSFDASTPLNFTQKYFAFSTTRIASIPNYVSPGYNGGASLINNSTPPGTEYVNSLKFNATFSDSSAATAVPFGFNPGQGIALGLPLFIGLRMLKKRRALKKSTREAQEMVRSQ